MLVIIRGLRNMCCPSDFSNIIPIIDAIIHEYTPPVCLHTLLTSLSLFP